MALHVVRLQDMKHYLYRSGPKLRDLYSQTGSKLGDIVGNIEWRINLGDVAEIKRERSPRAINEHYMMKAVVRALEKAGKVGTITNPKEYIKGIMPMKWGLYAGRVVDEAPDGPLVYFGGLDVDKRKLVALGGSSKNVLGHEGATSTTSLSVTQSIVAALRHGFETGSLKAHALATERELDLPRHGDRSEPSSASYPAIGISRQDAVSGRSNWGKWPYWG